MTGRPEEPPESRAGAEESTASLGEDTGWSADSFLLEAARIDDVAPPDLADRPGRVIAGRYSLVALLGRGSYGEVWEAEDRVGGERVALKLLRRGASVPAARVRREIAALRFLRLPGVVRLIDEGDADGRAFIAMERVIGAPFPGVPIPCSWAALAGPLSALLETLARVHAMGVIHRDLKPGNVLVDAEGRPTILDLGLSYIDVPGADGLTEAGQVLGTPAYLAPEQITGGAISARADLYAVGAIAYAALTGRVPHEAGDLSTMLRGRIVQRPRPLKDLAPDVPGPVAALIDQLLATDPAERPASALKALERLRGQRVAPVAPELPYLGSGAPLRAAREALVEGRAVDLVGPPGSGRSRALEEIASALEGEGRRVIRAVPARAPFASLEPLVGTMLDDRSRRLADVTAAVERALASALAEGAILVVDDAERLDRASASVIERGRSSGAVLRAFAGSPGAPPSPLERAPAGARLGAGASASVIVALAPLDEVSLRPLFAGPDRLLHLREDAAAALFLRTGGLPARVAHELSAWVRAGLARRDGRELVIDRDAIDRLLSGLHVAAPLHLPPPGAPTAPLPPRLEDLAAWIELARPHADVELLSAATGEPLWRVEAELEDLIALGAARSLPNGRVEACVDVTSADPWPPDRKRAAHRAVAAALPLGAEGRLWHLLAGSDDLGPDAASALAREALEVASRLAQDGQLGRAFVPLAEVLRVLRRIAPLPRDEVASLLSLWVEVALTEGTPRALDRALYELSRPGLPQAISARVAHLAELVRAALAVSAWAPEAGRTAEAVRPFESAALERRRHGLRVLAARRTSLEREEAVLAEIARWVEERGDPLARASLAGWLGRLRYAEGRFEEAAQRHAEAASGAAWITAKTEARLDGAAALMEAFRHEEAAALAEEALRLARRCRHAFYEGRAEYLLRAIAYRAGRAGRVDERAPLDRDLVEAAARLNIRQLEGMVCLNEAAVAYRGGDAEAARELSLRAYRVWKEAGHPLGPLLAGALFIANGGALPAPEVASLAARAAACGVPGVGIQALALLAQGGQPRSVDEAGALSLAELVPRAFWARRMEVLSVEESIERVRAGAA